MRIHIPEVIEPDEKLPADLVALRRFAFLMDEAVAIPGTRKRVGLDAAVGLIPGIGDVIGGIMSALIVIAALRHRVPMRKIARMIINILIDVFIGEIPILGDIFDFLFEKILRNSRILMMYRDRRQRPRTTAQFFFTAALIVTFILVMSVGAAIASIVGLFWLAEQRHAF